LSVREAVVAAKFDSENHEEDSVLVAQKLISFVDIQAVKTGCTYYSYLFPACI
jgi:hypothetical protein